jgi:hypothetical protein
MLTALQNNDKELEGLFEAGEQQGRGLLNNLRTLASLWSE